MNKTIIVKNLSKKYKISINKDSLIHRSFKEDCTSLLKKLINKAAMNKYEIIWALKNLTFSAEAGDILGLLGTNGSGKSTLLKIISKVTMPTSGDIKINGKVGSLLEVGTGFHHELSGRENIFFAGSILGMKRKDVLKYFDQIVYFSEVEKFLDVPLKRYSSGMMLRLGFSVISHLKYDVLLIDEVLAVGDKKFYDKSVEMIKNSSKEGKTVIFVSHRQESILTLCNKALLLKNGQKKGYDFVDKIFDKYLKEENLQFACQNK